MHPSYESLLNDVRERSLRYLRQIGERRVAPSPQALDDLAKLGGPLPSHGEDPAAVIGLLDEIGSPATMATVGPRFFGFVVGGALPATVAAQWLAAVWDQNACVRDLSPVAAKCEEVALEWLTDLLQLPGACAGAFVTGAQMANFTALAAARHAALQQVGWDVEAHGLFGAPPITVVVGDEAHVTVLKALTMLGLGRERIVRVPADSQGRLRVEAIPHFSAPAIVCAQVGNVNTGACDPLAEICDLAHQRSAWVHVDGAFGLWAAASPAKRDLMRGVERADSWAFDAHKWLNVPQDCGIALVRDVTALRAAMAISAGYLGTGESREPMQLGPESSRRARGVEVWTALRHLGRQGVIELVERSCDQARRFAAGLQQAGFEVLNDVTLNQVLVSFGHPELTHRVVREIQNEGTCWCGGTVWQGRTAMRISVCNWATTDADIDTSLAAVIRIASSAASAAG